MPGEIILALDGALGRSGQVLTIHLDSRGGRWTEGWAEAFAFNTVLHKVDVLDAQWQADALRLTLAVEVRSDFFIKGGNARYELSLRRAVTTQPAARAQPRLRSAIATHFLDGTFSGSFAQMIPPPKNNNRPAQPAPLRAVHAVSGSVEGVRLQPADAPADFVPPEPAEFPRMLIRKRDVPALRQRARTPLGRAILGHLKRTNHEVAEGIVYQLTGDMDYARRCYQRCATSLSGDMGSLTRGYGGHETEHTADFIAGHQATVAYAWDLCYDGWDEDQRHALRKWLADMCHFALYRPWTYSNTGSTGSILKSSTFMNFPAGGAMSLTLWGFNGSPPKEPRMDRLMARLLAQHPDWFGGVSVEERHRQWETEVLRWQAAGGMNLEYFDMVRYARQALSCTINQSVGEGGSTRQHILLDYAIAFQNLFGRSVTGRPDLAHAAAGIMFKTTDWRVGPDGTVPWGPDGIIAVTVPDLARYLALSDPRWRGAIQAYWLKLVGLTAQDLQTEQGANTFVDRSFALGGKGDAFAPLYALQHFTGQVQEPQAVLPRTWANPCKGNVSYRSGSAGEAVVVDVESCIGPSAGHFGISGLGARWTGVFGGKTDTRSALNAVQTPGTWSDVNALGRMTELLIDPDGLGGRLSMRLDNHYKTLEEVEVAGFVTKTEGWITTSRPVVRHDVVAKDVGSRATRAFAVDFSGRCGAPALVVIADRVTGPQAKMWTFNIDPALGQDAVRIDGNTFTLRQGHASLRATFLAPEGVQLRRMQAVGVDDRPDSLHDPSKFQPTLSRTAIEATAAPAACGDFLVVMTLQRGEAPTVEISGKGLEAAARIGRRTVRFDGQKVLLGD